MAIVPALFALLGRSAWWLPRWLDHVLPRIDVEGEKFADPGVTPVTQPAREPQLVA
jgi:RND superfamily putative drug exporter